MVVTKREAPQRDCALEGSLQVVMMRGMSPERDYALRGLLERVEARRMSPSAVAHLGLRWRWW